MSAPLSLRDKQFAYLVSQYGPGLSYADMLQKYLGNGSNSISDLMNAAYPGPGSMNDDYYAALGGSGSLSDKQYGSSSGGVSTAVVNLVTNPRPASTNSWPSNDAAKWTISYAANEILVNRLAPAEANYAASVPSCGLLVPNPVLKAGVNYQRSIEVWVDQAGTVVQRYGVGFTTGTVLPANTWTKVVNQFIGTGVAAYVTALDVDIVGVVTGTHVKFRKAMLAENPSGQELAYADGNSPGWSWSGAANSSTSSGPAIYEVPTPIDDLLKYIPFYIGHRGAGDVWPEHTQVAYTGAHDAGMKAIEVSTQVSSDSWAFCMHDAGATGLDRTTNGTGDPKTKTRAQLEALVVDIANCGPYWVAQGLKLPDLQTVLTGLLADKTVIFLECKDYATPSIDLILSRIQTWFPTKFKTQIIWKSHVTGAYGLAAARAAGMKCWAYIDYPLVTQQVTDAQARADYIGIPRYDGGTGLTDGEVDTVVSTIGAMKAISWEPKRRFEVAKLLAKGVDGFVSPSGRYILESGPNRSQDDFASGKWAPGDIPFDSSRNFVLDSGTAWFNTTATNPSVVMGSLSPSGPYFEIEYEFKYDTVPVATLGSGIAFSKPDDQRYQFQLAGNPSGGYHTLLRQNGQLQLYSHIAGSASGTQLGSTIATAALNNTDWAKIRVRVDSNGIQLQRMDGTPSTIITSTDNVNRGGYFHLSRNHAAATNETVRFRNIKVTAL